MSIPPQKSSWRKPVISQSIAKTVSQMVFAFDWNIVCLVVLIFRKKSVIIPFALTPVRSLCLNAKCVFVTIIYTVDPVTIVYASTVQLAMRLKPFYILAKFAKKSEQQTNKQENERKWLERECVRLKEKWDSMKGTWGWQCTSAVLCVLFVYVVSIFCISIFACCNGNVIS